MNTRQRVLVVDDQTSICEGVGRILRRRGWDVDKAADGRQAIEAIDREPFDLVIADLMMPRVSGMELLRYVRDNHPEIGVVMITGYASIDSAVEATKIGAAGYVPKPFTPEELLEVVDRAVKEAPARRQAAAPIDADEPFDRTSVVEATSETFADGVTRTDLPGRGPSADPDFCVKGEMKCKKLAKTGKMCKGDCPILAARARKAAQNLGLAATVRGMIDVDMPFNFDEVAAATSPAYASMVNPSGIPMRYAGEEEYVEGRQILVIDDEPVVCNSLRRILSRLGHAVDQALEPAEGLAMLGRKAYDLVLLDLRLRGMSGIDVLKTIRNEHPGVKVIIVTGYASIESAVETTRLGAAHYIAKPFTPEELVRATNEVLQAAA